MSVRHAGLFAWIVLLPRQRLEERSLLFESRQCSREHSLFGVLFVFRERKPRNNNNNNNIHIQFETESENSLQILKLSLSLSHKHRLAHNHTGNDRCRLVTHRYNKRLLFEYKIEARFSLRIGKNLE